MYTPVSSPTYDEAYKKFIKGDREKEKRVKKSSKTYAYRYFFTPCLKVIR